jgi:hypothetical protein
LKYTRACKYHIGSFGVTVTTGWPASPNKLAMPMQQGVWTHEERWPSSEEPAGCSEKHTIGILQTRASDLAAKNRELVSKHDDLELLELTRPETQRRHRERTPKEQIHKRDKQEQARPKLGLPCKQALLGRPIEFTHPTGVWVRFGSGSDLGSGPPPRHGAWATRPALVVALTIVWKRTTFAG